MTPKLLISASRRTDIPAVSSDWFFERLTEGFVNVLNPYNAHAQKTVSLLPQDVLGIVFWSKNPESLWIERSRLYDYHWSVNFTLTGYDCVLEPSLPPLEKRLAVFEKLSVLLSPEKIQWRFDPILFTKDIGEKETLNRFKNLLTRLEGKTKVCVVSFYQPYRAAQRRLGPAGIFDPDPKIKLSLGTEIEKLAAQKKIEVRWCCQDWATGRKPAKCIDALLFDKEAGVVKDQGQRKGCTCDKSIDIGSYNTCRLKCMYCYANR